MEDESDVPPEVPDINEESADAPEESAPLEDGAASEEGAPPEEAAPLEESTGTKEDILPEAPKTAANNQHEKIKKVHVRSYLVLEGEPNQDATYLPCLPEIKPTNEKYKPILYTFRVPDTKGAPIRNVVARRVPFYVQLDHSIAVIWELLNSETENKLGVAQIQWALNFLKAIHNRYGESSSSDIEYLIDVMEKNVMEQYADMSNYIETMSECYYKPPVNFETVEKEVPFSANYSEMIKLCPEPTSAYRVPSMTEEELQRELENIKEAAGVSELQNLDSISREKAIDFLSSWKKEQVEKIQAEIERLKSIENMLKSVDNARFTGKIDTSQITTFLSP